MERRFIFSVKGRLWRMNRPMAPIPAAGRITTDFSFQVQSVCSDPEVLEVRVLENN